MSLVDTRLQTLRAKYPSRLDRVELRGSQYPVLEAVQAMSAGASSIITPEMKQLIAKSWGLAVEVPVVKKPNTTIISVRTCVVPVTATSSEKVQLTFVTRGFNVTIFPEMNRQNQISDETDFLVQTEAGAQKMAAEVEAAVVAALELYRNTYWSGLTGYYAQSGNAYQVPLASQADFYSTVPAVMQAADFVGPYHVMASTMHQVAVRRMGAQGSGNATNTAWQLQGLDFNYTNRIVPGSGVGSVAYLLTDGAIGLWNRNDSESVKGYKLANGKTWELVNLPILDMDVSHYFYEDCVDASGIAEVVAAFGAGTASRTIIQAHQFVTDTVVVTPYIPGGGSKYAPIIKAEFLTT